MKTYKAVVVGGGLMGALLDQPSDNPPQTHAGGYVLHPAFDLKAICDANPDQLLKKWGCPIFDNLDSMLETIQPDVISVAVSGGQQPEILKRILEFQPLAVIAEKPLSMKVDDSIELTNAFTDAGIPLIVNYSRRFVPIYRDLATRFSGDEKVLSVVIKYGKGLIHNGLHAIDLARLLFGEVVKALPLTCNHDYSKDDPSISAFMIMDRAPQLFLVVLDDRAYTHFEVDIHTDRSRYLIDHDHRNLTIWNVQNNTGTPPGLRLVKQGVQETGHEKAISYLVENLFQVLEKGAMPDCTGQDAISAQRVAETLKEMKI